jgi:hypothetical protein
MRGSGILHASGKAGGSGCGIQGVSVAMEPGESNRSCRVKSYEAEKVTPVAEGVKLLTPASRDGNAKQPTRREPVQARAEVRRRRVGVLGVLPKHKDAGCKNAAKGACREEDGG